MRRSVPGPYIIGSLVLLLASWGAAAPSQAAEGASHPLDPLTEQEIARAVELLRDDQRNGAVFPTIALAEPSKEELTRFAQGEAIPRRAAAVVMTRQPNFSFEAVVDLTAGKVIQWKPLPGVQPIVLLEEYELAAQAVRSDPRWQAAIRKRGITDFESVHLDGWAPGAPPKDEAGARRLMRVLAFVRGAGTNPYGRPIEGIVAMVDVNQGKVVQVVDSGVVPVSDGAGTDFFDPKAIGPLRQAPRPLLVAQPQGTSFTMHGHEIRWQNWRFRYSLHPREGLVLHTVGYEEGGRVRPIVHRLSVAEMVVPYGDPSPTWNWRSAFDQGEYGLGRTSNQLTLGGDVPAHATLLDAVFANDRGEPYVQPRSVALYEQDGGLLWRHLDEATGRRIARRARQLVIGYVATIGNYDYGLNYIFHQDGSLEVRVDLTGILLVKGVESQQCELCLEQDPARQGGEARGDQRFGTLVDRRNVAINHQHLFSFRIDFDVEGTRNSIAESIVRAVPPGEENPAANAFVHVERPLATEREARRDLNLEEHRRWKVYNPTVRNELGHFAAYLLEPGGNSIAYLGEESSVRRRAGYIGHHLWATRFRPGEDHAAGPYPRQREAPDGLPVWSGDESLVNEDLVAWYTLGVTHVPRAEEWPVMPTAHVGFKLVPSGFFSRSPALDVPE